MRNWWGRERVWRRGLQKVDYELGDYSHVGKSRVWERAQIVLKPISAPGSFGLSLSDSGSLPSGLATDLANEYAHHVETIRVLERPEHVW